MKSFDSLGLAEPILRAVKEKGYTTPSPIQAKVIPPILKGNDVLAAAQTGTGKTAGFTLPALHLMAKRTGGRRHIRTLVLTPTRELAAQVQDNIEAYSKHLDLQSCVVFGGVGLRPQINQLKRGVDILVATPGRLIDLCDQGVCDLSKVEMLVLDEADRMLDMGFIQPIRKIVSKIPSKRQNLLFSATFSKEIRALTKEFLKNPVSVEVSPENTTAQTVQQLAYRCDQHNKTELTTHLIKEGNWEQVLIFTRTKHGANRLSDKLNRAGITASAIHGNKSQGSRTKSLEGFKQSKIQVLVATDIAARGIDIAQLPHVINFELPNVPADYVHRIGRTGRAGKEGQAVSLVCNDERPFLSGIEKLISKKIKLLTEEGFEPSQWTDRAPTASEVLKADAARKAEARKTRGPRKNTPRKPQAKSQDKSSGQKRSSNESKGGKTQRRRRNYRSRSRQSV
ncbi:ATP-dependent RNA helicase RhlE [Rubritalea halochordaticola]|uniref:ATP-dependent RNA helicase RhlE n=1 Tax=Rubritalea halochordaticola TaxID=714537 RepID=A0ABP9UV32_9BACT